MLLDKRFARPRADLRHRSKRSDVRRQGRDSPRSFSLTVLTTLLVPTRFPGRTSHRVLSHPRTPLTCSSSAASVGIVPHGQWAHHDKLRLALIDRSAKLMEPSSGLSFASRRYLHTLLVADVFSTSRSNAALTPPLAAASGIPHCTARLPLVVLSSPSVHSPSDLSRPERRPLLGAHGRQPLSQLKTSRAHDSVTFLSFFHSWHLPTLSRPLQSRLLQHREVVFITQLNMALYSTVLRP